MEHYFPGLFWWFFPVGVVIALAACLATAWMISRRNPMVDRFTLAPKTVDAPYLDYSLNYDELETRSAFLDILKYLDISELSRLQLSQWCQLRRYEVFQVIIPKPGIVMLTAF